MDQRELQQKDLLVFLFLHRVEGSLLELKLTRGQTPDLELLLYICHTWSPTARVLYCKSAPEKESGKLRRVVREGEEHAQGSLMRQTQAVRLQRGEAGSHQLACLMECEIVVSVCSCCVMIISVSLSCCALTSSQPLPLV